METAMGTPVATMTTDASLSAPNFFWSGRWKQARMVAIVDVVFESILLILSGAVGWPFGIAWTLFALIGSSITVGACCCRDNRGKGIAVAHIVLVALSFIGSFVNIAILSAVTSYCNDYDFSSNSYATKAVCDYIKALLSFEIICLVCRIAVIVCAARLSCCRPTEWNIVGVHVAPQHVYQPQPVFAVMTQPPQAHANFAK